MERSQFAQTEGKVIEEAKQLRAKLVEMKRRKEQQNAQAIRSQLSAVYTKMFEDFKLKLETQCEDQLTSLELAKELRVTEIIDVENRLRELMANLDSQELHLREKLQELNSSHQDALNFLQQEEMRELSQLRSEKEREMATRVQNYRQSIDIE